MKKKVSVPFRLYQLFVVIPVIFLASMWAGSTMALMCTFAGWLKRISPVSLGIMTRPDWWGSFASRLWGKIIVRISLLKVEVSGKENIKSGESYVFVANHQGAYDIPLVCGYLNSEVRFMLKRSLEKVPFLGVGCKYAGYVFVDKGNTAQVRSTYLRAEKALKEGTSLMVFPEGARSFTGHMGVFRRGAFMLADELQLPVVPMTINGSFDVMPRTSDGVMLSRHKLSLTIHKPIYPTSQGAENTRRMRDESYETVMSGLVPEYQGFINNPDQ